MGFVDPGGQYERFPIPSVFVFENGLTVCSSFVVCPNMKLADALVFLHSQFFKLLFNRVGKIAWVKQVLIKFVEIRVVDQVLVAGEKLSCVADRHFLVSVSW